MSLADDVIAVLPAFGRRLWRFTLLAYGLRMGCVCGMAICKVGVQLTQLLEHAYECAGIGSTQYLFIHLFIHSSAYLLPVDRHPISPKP